jgi:hypothetical protein
MNFPKGKIAILVTHGIGQQNPFETLDQFVTGYLAANAGCLPKEEIVLEHRVSWRTAASGAPWLESFIRVRPADTEDPANPPNRIDFHEYYWANHTQRLMSPGKVLLWFFCVVDRAAEYAKDDHAALQVQNGMKPKQIVDQLNAVARSLGWFRYVLRVMVWLTSWAASNTEWGRWIWGGFNKLTGVPLTDYLADAAVYATTDIKEEHYKVRQAVLGGCVERMAHLLEDDAKGNPKNEKVILAGHSLGSVVVYDTLNRLANQYAKAAREQAVPLLPLERLRALVTFGSPLDHFYLYFREERQAGSPDAHLRRQMLHQLHHFRQCEAPPQGEFLLEDHVSADQLSANPLADLKWRNYYHPLDPVSTSFVFYLPDANVPIEDLSSEDNKFVLAHNGYWRSNQFHQDIHEKLVSRI